MPYLSGAEVLVASLAKEGVEVIFGIPGVQIMDAVDAIYCEKSIRWISTRHEQTAAYMAYGYARTTEKIGVAMVLPGPGALNTAAAIGISGKSSGAYRDTGTTAGHAVVRFDRPIRYNQNQTEPDY